MDAKGSTELRVEGSPPRTRLPKLAHLPSTSKGAKATGNPKLRRSYKAYFGDWKRDGDELVQAALTRDGLLLFGDFTWTDYDFSAEVKAVSDTGCCCLRYRVTAGEHNEFGLINWHGSKDFLAVTQGGKHTRLEDRPGGFKLGTWYSLRVRVRGKQCQCFRDGKLIFDREDDLGPRGAVGFRTEVTAVRFRNILVTDPDGKALFAGLPELPATADQCFPTTEPDSAHELGCLKGHGAPVAAVGFSPDGRRVVSISNCEHRIYQANLGRFKVVGGPADTLRLWDTGTGKELDTCARADPPRDPATAYKPIPGSESPYILHYLTDFPADDQGLVKRLGLWEIVGDRLQCRLLAPKSIREFRYACVTPDGRQVLALDQTGSIWEWDLVGKKFVRRFLGGLEGVTTTAMAHDCRRALLARKGQPFAEIDLDTGQETGLWKEVSGDVSCLVYSPDNRWILAGERDGTLRLWDVASRQELQRFAGHQGPVWAMVFSADGRRALTGGDDRSVRLWDLDGKRELACFTGHAGAVQCVAFSPDGRRAASGSADYTVRLWRLPP